MKNSKIIAGLLVLLGFGSCCNRPAKSKAPPQQVTPEAVADTTRIPPIMLMYGVPNREFRPVELRRDTTETQTEAEQPQSEPAAEGKNAEKSE